MTPPATPWTEMSAPETPYLRGIPSGAGEGLILFIIPIAAEDLVNASTSWTKMSVPATGHTEMSTPSTPWTKVSI